MEWAITGPTTEDGPGAVYVSLESESGDSTTLTQLDSEGFEVLRQAISENLASHQTDESA